MASSAGKGGGASALPLAGIYEMSGRPNNSKAADLSQATWDMAAGKAFVERPKKQLSVMGHWVGGVGKGGSGEGAAHHKMLALFPEEMLLLVEQGLLVLRLPETTRVLTVAEAQALALSNAHVCPLYFEAYAHARELGMVALRLEIISFEQNVLWQQSEFVFRGRPILALWSAEGGCQKGRRQSRPDFILVTTRACETLPSASEWEYLDRLATSAGAAVKFAVVDDTGSPVMFDCCSGPASLGGSVTRSPVTVQDDQLARGVADLPEAGVVDEEDVNQKIKLQGDKVRQLKADANLPYDKTQQTLLVSEIQELKRLKALLPGDEHSHDGTRGKKRKKT